MRPSTVFLLCSCSSVLGACATGESLDSVSTPGFNFGSPPMEGLDSGVVDSGRGARPGMGSGGAVGAGGVPVGAGAMGGTVGTGGALGGMGGGAIPSGSGGAPGAGGASGNGGALGNGGSQNGGGTASTGGASTGGCQTGEKSCGGICVSPAPSNGCGARGCTACTNTAPAHGVLACNAQGQCDFDCLSGYTKSGSSCVSSTGRGTGGTSGGGAGGTSGGGTGGAAAVTSCTSADGTHTNTECQRCPPNQWNCCQKQPLANLAPLCICVDNVTQNLCQ